MPSKKKAIIVTIRERAHKPKKGKPAQPWTVRIQEPGNKPPTEIEERYTRAASAKKGALRKLHAFVHAETKDLFVADAKGDLRKVEFVVEPKKK